MVFLLQVHPIYFIPLCLSPILYTRKTDYEALMNYTPDISDYTSLSWFQGWYFYDEDLKSNQLCRWLGPSSRVGQSFFSYVLFVLGKFIAISSVLVIEDHEITSDYLKEECTIFVESLESIIGNNKQPLTYGIWPDNIYYLVFDGDPDVDDLVLPYV